MMEKVEDNLAHDEDLLWRWWKEMTWEEIQEENSRREKLDFFSWLNCEL